MKRITIILLFGCVAWSPICKGAEAPSADALWDRYTRPLDLGSDPQLALETAAADPDQTYRDYAVKFLGRSLAEADPVLAVRTSRRADSLVRDALEKPLVAGLDGFAKTMALQVIREKTIMETSVPAAIVNLRSGKWTAAAVNIASSAHGIAADLRYLALTESDPVAALAEAKKREQGLPDGFPEIRDLLELALDKDAAANYARLGLVEKSWEWKEAPRAWAKGADGGSLLKAIRDGTVTFPPRDLPNIAFDLAAHHPDVAESWAKEAGPVSLETARLVGSLAKGLAIEHPRRAAALLVPDRAKVDRTAFAQVAGRVAGDWLVKYPDELADVHAWLTETLDDDKLGLGYKSAVNRVWSRGRQNKSDSAKTMDFVFDIVETAPISPANTGESVDYLGRYLAKHDLERLLALAEKTGGIGLAEIAGIALEQFALELEFEKGAQLSAAVVDHTRDSTRSVARFVCAWAYYDPEAAARFAEDPPEYSGFDFPCMLVRSVALGWTATDPAAALGWVSGLKNRHLRSHASAALAERLGCSHPEVALEAAGRITDDRHFEDFFRSDGFNAMAAVLPTETEAFLRAAEMSDERRDAAIKTAGQVAAAKRYLDSAR